MKEVDIEQSSKAFYGGHSGPILLENLVNGCTSH